VPAEQQHDKREESKGAHRLDDLDRFNHSRLLGPKRGDGGGIALPGTITR
jgi:hypothetical protein